MIEKQSYNDIDFYNFYIEYVDSDLYRINKTTYKNIITDFFAFIKEQFIEKSRSVKLPCRFGRIQIIKKKPKSWLTSPKSIDYKMSKELKYTVYHLNEHSDGYKYRLHWDKHDCNILNKRRYQMIMPRDTKRRLAFIIKNKICDYIEI